MSSFQEDLNGSNTPDFILARYLSGCLGTFNAAVCDREKWYGRENLVQGGVVEQAPEEHHAG